ncbi:recombinase family protein [Streptomyces sp. NBC_00841]|uniref:recombinase family protein n=1 Tax=Streptomyces sp. NBC_00841 TaxID=2975847 RepID=UPI002DDB08E2|nr:recombinase family protein [Streptomyces sp. NBC_00841]WRZ98083.1 recombinase family protein [Streptomyces sp. NBC_00841]
MQRADYQTLVSLGLSDEDMAELGLWEPASADPAGLLDAYIRRSNKKEDTATLRGHLRDVARYARSEGLQIRHVWFEQLSASKSYVRRREFENATNAILDGLSKTMAVWKTDRFDRRGMGAVGRMLDEFDQRRARLVSVSEGLDSSKGGRMVFAILSERAREEAKDIALRVKIGHDAHKAEGRRGTGVPPFGVFSKPGSGTVEPHRDEYERARRMAQLLLDGMSATQVAATVNAEGSRQRSGVPWTGGAVSRLAQSPLWAGLVPQRERIMDEHGNPTGRWRGYGDPATGADGKPMVCGTGVVTATEWYLIKAKIDARTSAEVGKGKRRGKPEIKYQGTGVYTCGRCGGPSNVRGNKYQCQTRQNAGPAVCLGVSTMAGRVDAAVGQAWIAHVSALELGDPVLMIIARRWLAFSDPETQAHKEEIRAALGAAQNRVKKLEDDYYVYGKISEERYEELSAGQRSAIEGLSATLSGLDVETDLTPLMDTELLREAWEDATMADRRMLLKCALGKEGVKILPAAHQGDKTPIERRLVFDWVSRDSGE